MKHIKVKIAVLIFNSIAFIPLSADNLQQQIPSNKQAMITAKPESHYANLKEIEWLIGNWQHQNEGLDIRVNSRWDKYKNFIIQDFEWRTDDEESEEVELKQIIGWDPIAQKIHSWVFDSDGGFGEGIWTKVNDQWHVKMLFTLPDGRKGSATNVYSKSDNNSYNFSSFGRDINGEVLPNIKPIKLIKKQ